MCRAREELGTLPGPPEGEEEACWAGSLHGKTKPAGEEPACLCMRLFCLSSSSLKTKYQAGWESQEETLKC